MSIAWCYNMRWVGKNQEQNNGINKFYEIVVKFMKTKLGKNENHLLVK